LTLIRGRCVVYAVLLFVLGLAYRATFISQGFNGTDEGWLQTLGQRVANGQVPYRDFFYVLPPVSVYREAALIKVFGDGYGILASRWVFVIEATLASVVAFIIIRRFVGDHLAFLSALPTIFFSVIFYYFSNYTYDAVLLTLVAMALLTYADRAPRTLSIAAGAAAALAFLAKPTFLVFLVLPPLAGVVSAHFDDSATGPRPAWWRRRADWRYFALGYAVLCIVVFGYMATAGALGSFVYQAFALTRQAFPTSLSFLILQDMPDRLLTWPAAPSLVVILVLLLFRGRRIVEIARLPLLAVALGYFVFRVLRAPGNGPPTSRQELLVVVALGLLLLLNAVALVEAVRRRLMPVELPLYALMLQYVTQINYSGLRYSYMGTYLSLPVALLLVRAWLRARSVSDGKPATNLVPAVVATLLAAWFVVGGIAVTRGTVYRDADRARLTASFSSGKLAGISTRPANVALINGMLAAIDQYTNKGDPALVFPDFPAIYFLTDRINPTRIDWYDPGEIIPSMTEQAVADLQRNPPRVVFIETFDEADVERHGPPLDYLNQPKWRAMYVYLKAHYRQIGTVGDVAVLVPGTGS
jgi:Dolichyl-phosphate-mannose-protein mannosyltransferase